jgi:hypothetical protein
VATGGYAEDNPWRFSTKYLDPLDPEDPDAALLYYGTARTAPDSDAFRDSVEDYLDFCAQRGETPEKPYSGKFIVRIEPELHKAIATRARIKRKSLNRWVHDVLADAVR